MRRFAGGRKTWRTAEGNLDAGEKVPSCHHPISRPRVHRNQLPHAGFFYTLARRSLRDKFFCSTRVATTFHGGTTLDPKNIFAWALFRCPSNLGWLIASRMTLGSRRRTAV